MRCFLFAAAAAAAASAARAGRDRRKVHEVVPAHTSGSLAFPHPKAETHGTGVARIDQEAFRVTFLDGSAASTSAILKAAMERCEARALAPPRLTTRGRAEPQLYPNNATADGAAGAASSAAPSGGVLRGVTVFVSEEDIGGPKPADADESFKLDIALDGAAAIKANSIWGALYGLELFPGLVERRGHETLEVRRLPIAIDDAPRFAYRGLLIDPANHFLPLDDLLRTVDAMAVVRFNVLHLHISGSYSFPFESPSNPRLAKAGAWASDATYSVADMQELAAHARSRGVRLLVEADAPGHTLAWGWGVPEMTPRCGRSGATDPVLKENDLGWVDQIPVDPTAPVAASVYADVLGELVGFSGDAMVHLGGDEVKYWCWKDDPDIQVRMAALGIAQGDYQGLENYWWAHALNLTAALGVRPIVWEDVFLEGDSGDGDVVGNAVLTPETGVIAEVWGGQSHVDALQALGYDTIAAYPFYLDRQNPIDDGPDTWFFMDTMWQMYGAVLDDANLGGEASMWSEFVDTHNLDPMVWPRAAAVAERLWSPAEVVDAADAAARLQVLRCRLVQQVGVNSGPVWPDNCAPA